MIEISTNSLKGKHSSNQDFRLVGGAIFFRLDLIYMTIDEYQQRSNEVVFCVLFSRTFKHTFNE